MVSGRVRVTTLDRDNQEVVIDEPAHGEFFGFASMLEQTPHQTTAIALEQSECLEVDRHDIAVLLQRKPLAGMDMLTVLGRQFHASQQLVRVRASRNPNEMIEKEATFGERIADTVAGFGGSWTFILIFLSVLVVYTIVNVVLRRSAWDSYPFILLNLFLSMLAAIQAPVIMMSQNRQDTKDRLRSELDFDVNRRAESEIQGLATKLNLLGDKMKRPGRPASNEAALERVILRFLQTATGEAAERQQTCPKKKYGSRFGNPRSASSIEIIRHSQHFVAMRSNASAVVIEGRLDVKWTSERAIGNGCREDVRGRTEVT
jgi:uncharacterized membrane protein